MIDTVFIDTLQIHNAANPDSMNLAVTRMAGLGSPPPRRRMVSRMEQHGARDYTRFYESRTIGLGGLARATPGKSANAAFDELKQALALDGGDMVLKFRRTAFAEDEFLTVRVADILEWEPEHNASVIFWEVALAAADPIIYAVANKTGSYDPTTAGSGSGIDFQGVAHGINFPIDFAGVTTTNLIVVNQGTFPAPAVFTITGPATNPIIDNDTTGLSLYTQGLTLTSGQSIVIDTGARTVLLGGVSRPDLIDARITSWLRLVSGPNALRLRGTGFVATQTQLKVDFHDARI